MNLREMAELEHGPDSAASIEEIERELRLDLATAVMAEPAGPLARKAKNFQRPRNGLSPMEEER